MFNLENEHFTDKLIVHSLRFFYKPGEYNRICSSPVPNRFYRFPYKPFVAGINI